MNKKIFLRGKMKQKERLENLKMTHRLLDSIETLLVDIACARDERDALIKRITTACDILKVAKEPVSYSNLIKILEGK